MTDILILFVVIAVFSLIISGDVEELRWGSFSIKLREISSENIDIQSQMMKIKYPLEIEKGSINKLYGEMNVICKKQTDAWNVLIIRKKRRTDYYNIEAIRNYLETNFFEYVVFISNNKYQGYISAGNLKGLVHLERYGEDNNFLSLSDKINKWSLDLIPCYSTNCIQTPATIGKFMNKLINLNLKELPLVNENNEFISIVTKEEIFQEITKKLYLTL